MIGPSTQMKISTKGKANKPMAISTSLFPKSLYIRDFNYLANQGCRSRSNKDKASALTNAR